MKKGTIIIGVFVFLIITLSLWRSCENKEDVVLHGKDKITVQLQWFDGAQFCGLYVAQQKKFFDDENLVVELNPVNSFTSDPIAILLDGKADIAIATADQVLINKNEGRDIKAFGTVFNRSLACFMYKKGVGIEKLSDFQNKKIAVYKKFDTENIIKALFLKNGIDYVSENIIQAGSIDAFIKNEYDILGSYINNEPIDMNLQGINISTLDPVKDSVIFYSDTYITVINPDDDREKLQKKRDILRRFLRAANRGWEYAKNHSDESIKIMFSNAKNMIKDEARIKKESLSLSELVKYLGDGENNYYSYMKRRKWESMERDLYNIGRIKMTGYINDLCDFNLVDEAYAEKK